MKKLLSAVFLLLLFSPSMGQAQFDEFGIKLGLQTSGLYSEPIEVGGRRIGISLYAYSQWNLFSWLSTNIDLGYTQKGFFTSHTITDETGNIKGKNKAVSRLDYLSLIPLIKIKLPIGYLESFLGVGPNLNYLLNRKPGVITYFQGDKVEDTTVVFFDKTTVGLTFTGV